VIGADETVRVRYKQNEPQVEAQRRLTPRQSRPAPGQEPKASGATSKHARRVSSAKKVERERRQQAQKVRRAGIYAGSALGLLLLISACVALYRAPILPVRAVEVSGTSHLSKQAVEDLAGIPANSTLLRLPSNRIEKRLQSNPWIARATVEKQLPGTVRLTIVERRPLAVVDAGGTNLWVVSADGHWLGRQTPQDEGMVVVRDVDGIKPVAGQRSSSMELRNALRVIAGISAELRGITKVVSAPTIDKTALLTKDDVEVFIGSATQLGAKDRIVRQILRSKKDEVVYINVRVVESPIWRGLGDSP
jgi:cell division protein FtsQ